MTHPLAFLYETAHIRHAFGKHWCGPDKLPRGESVVVAQYPATREGGIAVTVLCSAWPSMFFTIRPESGDHQIETGTGMVAIAAALAEDFASGMIAIRPKQ